MRRNVICGLAILLINFTAAGANAEFAVDENTQNEELAAGMELLFMEMLGGSEGKPVFRDHGNGVYSLSVPLDELERGSQFLAGVSTAKAVTNLHHGHMVSTPSSLSTLIHAASATLNIGYNFWWAAVNTSADDVELKTKWSHKGPGTDEKGSEDLVYAAGTIMAFFVPDLVHTQAGVFKSSVKISGASNSKTKGGCFAQ
ncbi:MAG: hypothetical protein IH936_13090 [Acidobacteria bacterium]|nr:hypothetical protein [Acidobacteriota bacterium]